MTDKIESLITKIVQGNSADAEQTFNQIISQKASEALEGMRGAVTDQMFNQGQFSESFGPDALAKYAGKSKQAGDTAGDAMPKAKKPYVGNKIDLHLHNGKDGKAAGYDYWRSTTRSPTVKDAVKRAEEAYPEHKGKLKANFAESVVDEGFVPDRETEALYKKAGLKSSVAQIIAKRKKEMDAEANHPDKDFEGQDNIKKARRREMDEEFFIEGGGGMSSLTNAPNVAKGLGLDNTPGTSTTITKGADDKNVKTVTTTHADGTKTSVVTKG